MRRSPLAHALQEFRGELSDIDDREIFVARHSKRSRSGALHLVLQ
jgi:hypothetical protein